MPDTPPAEPFAEPARAILRRGGLLAGDRRIAILLGLGIVLLLVAILAAVFNMARVLEDTRLVEHSLTVENSISRAAALNEQVETGRRGYLLSGSNGFRNTVRAASRDLSAQIDTLRALVADNPLQGRRADRMAALHEEREHILTQELARRPSFSGLDFVQFERDRGVAIVREIRAVSAEMLATEANLLQDRNRNQVNGLIQLYSIGGLAIMLLVSVLGTVIYLILRYNRSLAITQGLLSKANEGLEEAVAKRTAELQRANQEIQRFAYIVSHDLRSPLVNVLGFTSELDEARKTIRRYLTGLFERQPEQRDEAVWTAVDEDLPEALGFIRTSTEKMDRLINSILQLSRLGRRQLVPEPLDMNALAAGVIGNLHQRAADTGATVTAAPLPDIENDRMAVEQILSNLTENAIKYLQPGRPGEIRIEGRRKGKLVEIDVIDNGRGISPLDHERIFELFRRSGPQDQPGEGIGLANVRALAYRLGGWVEVESELDRGSRFRLSLPAKFVATEQPYE